MDLKQIKSIVIPEGEVKKIQIGNIVVWQKPVSTSFIKINESAEQPIEDFAYCKVTSKTFTAKHNIPNEYLAANNIQWEVTNLPEGEFECIPDGATLTISGYSTDINSKQVTITVTAGEYTDTKTYEFRYKYVKGRLATVASDSPNVDNGTNLPYSMFIFNKGFNTDFYISSTIGNGYTDKDYKLVSGSYPSCVSTSIYSSGDKKQIKVTGVTQDLTSPDEAGSITVQAYGFYDGAWYAGVIKTINWIVCNTLLRKKYNGIIRIDITYIERESSAGTYTFDISDWIAPVNMTYGGQVQPYLGTSSTGGSGKTSITGNLSTYTKYEIYTSNKNGNAALYLVLTSNSSKYTGTNSKSLSRYLNLKNNDGQVSMSLTFYTASKTDYTNGSYSAMPVITYPSSTYF